MDENTPTPEEELEDLTSEFKEAQEQAAYDIPEPPDSRTPVMTGFLVYVDEDGKAIATSEIEQALEVIKFRREATLDDIRRAATEVATDVDTILRTRSIVDTQMHMARQIQEQMQTQAMAQGLDLSKMRSQ